MPLNSCTCVRRSSHFTWTWKTPWKIWQTRCGRPCGLKASRIVSRRQTPLCVFCWNNNRSTMPCLLGDPTSLQHRRCIVGCEGMWCRGAGAINHRCTSAGPWASTPARKKRSKVDTVAGTSGGAAARKQERRPRALTPPSSYHPYSILHCAQTAADAY